MRGQGNPEGEVKKVDWEVEQKVLSLLQEMEEYSGVTQQQMVHMALKRFISQHKDYLPPEKR